VRLCMGEVEEGGAWGMRPPYIDATRQRTLSSSGCFSFHLYLSIVSVDERDEVWI
jgi:hypothetical protein